MKKAAKRPDVFRYFIRWYGEPSWKELSKAEFIREERKAGFEPYKKDPNEPATGGWANQYSVATHVRLGRKLEDSVMYKADKRSRDFD